MVSFKITNITYDTYDEEAKEHQTQEDLGLPTEMVVQIELQGDEEEWEIYDLLTYQIENQGYGWLVESFDFDTESKSAEYEFRTICGGDACEGKEWCIHDSYDNCDHCGEMRGLQDLFGDVGTCDECLIPKRHDGSDYKTVLGACCECRSEDGSKGCDVCGHGFCENDCYEEHSEFHDSYYGAEGLEFTDWAKQEHHGKKTSLKDWADHEIKTHGKSMSFQDWAKHEDKSHLRRYGAEEEGQTKIGETSAWEGRILGMNGKWRDGVYDIFRIMGAKTDDPYQRPIGYTMIHQGIDLSPENFTTDLGQLSTDVGEINFAGMTIGTGGDGSWPLWGAYEDIEDYYVRAQNKPKPTLSPDAKKEDYYNEDFRGRRQLWDDEFTNWLSKGDEGYPNKHKAQLEHQVLVGVRLGLANPISPTLRTKNAKGTFWVIEYPSLKHMITDVYSRQKPDKMYEYANTEHTVNQYFNNLKSLYPDGKFSEVARTEYQAAKKEFYIILPAFGWYQWTAMEYPLGYASPSREETARKEKRRLEIAMKQQTEREEMQKRERKEKYGAEHPSGEGKLKVSGQDFADGSLMVGVGTEDLGVGDPDLVEMMIDKDGKIDYFSLPIGLDGWNRTYNIKPSHYGKLKTEKETNTTPGGDFNRFYAESFEAQAPRGHKMMTKELGKKIPPLYSQDGKGDEAIVYAHYFNPYGVGEWWILEWDGKDEMFGYADLGFPELGYISLSELENVSIGGMELPIERDLHWREKTLGEVKQAVSKYRAESFSATKGIDTFTEPFEELSLDSGNIKKVIVGIGIGVAAILAYNKWK